MKKKEKSLSKKNKPSLQLKRKEVAGWLFLFFFISAGMFVLGVFVGRGTSPVQFDIEKLQKELIALREAVIKKELTRFKIDLHSANDKTNLGFYEALKESKGDDKLQSAISKQRDPLKQDRFAKNRPEKISSEKDRAAPGNNQTKGNFIIQVASLKDPETADKMVTDFIKKRYPAYKTIAKIPGKGIWYRIRIGSYKSKTEAERILARLKKDNWKPILIKQ